MSIPAEQQTFKSAVESIAEIPVTVLSSEFPTPDSIEFGIIFVHAIWSGPSVVSLRRLTRCLDAFSKFKIKFIVISADEIDYNEFQKSYGKFPSSGGWGETFWIRDKSLLFADGGYHKEDSLALIQGRVSEFFQINV